MSEESELQIIRKEGESSLTVSPIRSKLVARGRKDMELMLTVRTIKLEDSEEGHFGFQLQWKGTKLSFLAGTHEIPIDIDDAQKLAAFLIRGCTDLVWGSPTPISVGQQWSLHAAREISHEYPQAKRETYAAGVFVYSVGTTNGICFRVNWIVWAFCFARLCDDGISL